MKRIDPEDYDKYLRPPNKHTGVDGITIEDLEKIDLDTLPQITYQYDDGNAWYLKEGKKCFKLDRFTPRAGSIFFKPAFAGRQLIMGIDTKGEVKFTNGVWFSGSI